MDTSGSFPYQQTVTRRLANKLLMRIGFELVRIDGARSDIDESFYGFYRRCSPFTMTSMERMYCLYAAIRYATQTRVPGDVVECGVWRGGSSMLAALVLVDENTRNRKLYLYDTFAGMVEPATIDRTTLGMDARKIWRDMARTDGGSDWCFADLAEVRKNMASTKYPLNLIEFVEGRVEDTIPSTVPDEISVLRLDTDWYDSTLHELQHLYPRLAKGGVLILDDYGCWEGAKKATDEYFASLGKPPFLARIDSSGRIAIKR